MKLRTYLIISTITQQNFANLIGKKQTTISRYILGNRTPAANVISQIEKLTNGLVTYADWLPDTTTNKTKDIATIKNIIKNKKIKYYLVADYLKISPSRLTQKFKAQDFTEKEIARIVYYVSNCNTITGELKEPDTNSMGYVKIFRKHKLLNELSPTELKLLMVIILRANNSRRALVGDYEAIGLTEYEYRCAKGKLASLQYCEFAGTEKGTIATILPNKLFDL